MALLAVWIFEIIEQTPCMLFFVSVLKLKVRQHSHLDNLVQDSTPLVIRQHFEPPKKYVVLTSQGVHIFSKLRPIDILKQLLMDSHGQDSDTIKAFFMIQKEDQACATSLVLASMEAEDNIEIAEYATRGFFMFGGEPTLASIGINQTNLCKFFFFLFLSKVSQILKNSLSF